MQLIPYFVRTLHRSYVELCVGVDAPLAVTSDSQGNISIAKWNTELLGPQPTSEQIAAILAAPEYVDLEAYAAQKRWEKEVGGINVSDVPVATDDRSKQMILGARLAAQADNTFTTTWVGSDGNAYPLNATQIIGLSNAVLVHVNNCFTVYATLKAGITAGTITTTSQIDAAYATAS